jgi:hypothetical protein
MWIGVKSRKHSSPLRENSPPLPRISVPVSRGWFLRAWGESENRRPLIPILRFRPENPRPLHSPAPAPKTPSLPSSHKIQPSLLPNPRAVEVRCRDFEAGWFRSAPQAPASAETRPGCASEIVTMLDLPKIREPWRCLRTPTGWTSPPTHLREKHENPLVRIEEVAIGFCRVSAKLLHPRCILRPASPQCHEWPREPLRSSFTPLRRSPLRLR